MWERGHNASSDNESARREVCGLSEGAACEDNSYSNEEGFVHFGGSFQWGDKIAYPTIMTPAPLTLKPFWNSKG